ncbi:prenyltransferase/squalene oxidase repeat-containing protein [Actinomadura rugatobispora]|uniref:Prenyltransferase/squalene oxidase repeat-containing protein n=1 Tax=Actinomadura rugatobispora TaxID=1994 RepID=A0ABW1ACP2_9ACTN
MARVAGELIAGLVDEPWGQVSPSVYETGRLVTLAPWLAGHDRRVEFLLATQRPDGGWGAPDGYALVPTLSATEALLTTLRRGERGTLDGLGHGGGAQRSALAAAADRGVRMLLRTLPALDVSTIPDLPATEIITASLVEAVNGHLDDLRRMPPAALGHPVGRLPLPRGIDDIRLGMIHAALDAGVALPEKVLHALEVAGRRARGVRTIRPAATGTVGASPAATAAWLDERDARDPRHPARLFLEAVVKRHGGPVPCGIPITVFERGWVLSGLLRAGIDPPVPAGLAESLRSALGPVGTPAAEGLPADADTTSVAIYALGLLGLRYPPDALWEYETETHFCTWPGEDGFSISVNAHILEAFGHFAASPSPAVDAGTAARYAATIQKLTALLCAEQQADGSWLDRWHASPYYATWCCTLALQHYGGPGATDAVRRARRWVLSTQRPDGSWGRWEGSAEETAYALQILLLTPPDPGETGESAPRGYRFLLPSADDLAKGHVSGPALWHDKDLYLPSAIVRGAVLAALHLAQSGATRTGVC